METAHHSQRCVATRTSSVARRWCRFSLRSIALLLVPICLLFGLRANAIQRQQRALAQLRDLGAQLRLSETQSAVHWLLGAPTEVTEVHFLGPRAGDDNINDLVQVVSHLPSLKRMTFTETRISRQGEQQLRSRLTGVRIEVFTPILAPPVLPEMPRR
jgi:hypothetical protein